MTVELNYVGFLLRSEGGEVSFGENGTDETELFTVTVSRLMDLILRSLTRTKKGKRLRMERLGCRLRQLIWRFYLRRK